MVEVPILIPCKIRNTYRKKVTLARIVFQWKPNAWLGTMCLFSALFINYFFLNMKAHFQHLPNQLN